MKEAIGTLVDNRYESPRIQRMVTRAVGTVSGVEGGGYTSVDDAAQDVLDLLYSLMFSRFFQDWTPKPAAVAHFPLEKEGT